MTGSKEMRKRLERLEAGRTGQQVHVFRLAPDGSREQMSGEGEPKSRDLVVNVITHFAEHGTEPEPQPKEG